MVSRKPHGLRVQPSGRGRAGETFGHKKGLAMVRPAELEFNCAGWISTSSDQLLTAWPALALRRTLLPSEFHIGL